MFSFSHFVTPSKNAGSTLIFLAVLSFCTVKLVQLIVSDGKLILFELYLLLGRRSLWTLSENFMLKLLVNFFCYNILFQNLVTPSLVYIKFSWVLQEYIVIFNLENTFWKVLYLRHCFKRSYHLTRSSFPFLKSESYVKKGKNYFFSSSWSYFLLPINFAASIESSSSAVQCFPPKTAHPQRKRKEKWIGVLIILITCFEYIDVRSHRWDNKNMRKRQHL